MAKTEVIAFRKVIPKGSEVRLHERIKSDGYIERFMIRFYAGQERELQVQPYVLHKGARTEHFITYQGDSEPYLSGEDDRYEYPLSINVEYDDEVYVYCKNTSDTYDYTLNCEILIQYF